MTLSVTESLVDGLLLLISVYLLLGILFSIYFLVKGARELDEGVEGTPWHFKLLIWPGSVLLWVVLLTRILRK